jgi:Holliday junction resolvasome RuvABC endonuclease subunit
LTTIVGIDPSSRKLAAVVSRLGKEPDVETHTRKLPQDKPAACLLAYEWARNLVDMQGDTDVCVFVEMPVMGRGGPGSTIPQAQINGALLAGAQMSAAEVIPVNNARVKKTVVGKGNATKDDVRDWVKVAWPVLYDRIGKDQDLCDSAMIYVYGKGVVQRRNKIAKAKNLTSVGIRRAKVRR